MKFDKERKNIVHSNSIQLVEKILKLLWKNAHKVQILCLKTFDNFKWQLLLFSCHAFIEKHDIVVCHLSSFNCTWKCASSGRKPKQNSARHDFQFNSLFEWIRQHAISITKEIYFDTAVQFYGVVTSATPGSFISHTI